MKNNLPAVYVAHCDTTNPPPQLNYPPRQLQIDDCSNIAVKAHKYAVWKLLEYAVKQHFGVSLYDCNPVCNNGKWTANGINFSLSHSENVVCVAVSDQTIGVDVQILDNFPKQIADKVLTANEKQLYTNSPSDETMCKLWTKKEAIFKFGTQNTLCQIDTTSYPNATSEIHELFGKKYAVAICTPEPTPVNLQIVTLNN